MGTQNQVYAVGALQVLRLFGGAEAASEDDFLDATFFFEAAQLAEMAADAVNSVLADVAGVQDYEVGVFVVLHLRVASVPDHTPYPVGVVDVHLTPERPYARRL